MVIMLLLRKKTIIKTLSRGYERVEENVWHSDDKWIVVMFLYCWLRITVYSILEEFKKQTLEKTIIIRNPTVSSSPYYHSFPDRRRTPP